MKKNNYVICGVAGRSGGHILPCLTFMQQSIKDANIEKNTVLFFTTTHTLDTSLIQQFPHTIKTVQLNLENIPFKKPWLLPFFGIRAIKSFFTSLYYLYHYQPHKIISTGGYIAIPVFLAAKLLRIPLLIFELNVQPGKATSWLAPYCSKVHTCFQETQQFLPTVPCTSTMYPIRFTQENKLKTIPKHLIERGFNKKKKTIFITGGSQGSQNINRAFSHSATNLADTDLQIIHQTGNLQDISMLEEIYKNCNFNYYLFDFEKDMAPYYALADLIICRSGAGTLFEIEFFEKPCITIPLETKNNNHQVANAKAFAEKKPQLFKIISQEKIFSEPNILVTYIESLLYQPKV